MNRDSLSTELVFEQADAAFQQVARLLITRAQQTGTPLIVWRDGKIQALPASAFTMPPLPDAPAEPSRS